MYEKVNSLHFKYQCTCIKTDSKFTFLSLKMIFNFGQRQIKAESSMDQAKIILNHFKAHLFH